MSNSGKLVVLLMFAAALALGALGIGYHRSESHRAVRLWGPEIARLVARAPQVEVFRLEAAGPALHPDQAIVFLGKYRLLDRKDISAARGLTHLRSGLLSDHSYSSSPSHRDHDLPPAFEYALRFSDGNERATFVIAFAPCVIGCVENGFSAGVEPIAGGLRDFLDEQFAMNEGAASSEP